MNTPFRVKSDRLHSLSIAEGTTVGAMKEMLRLNGFDIDDTTRVEVRRHYGDTLIGANDTYMLQPGDCVKFITKSVSLVEDPASAAPKKGITETIKQRIKSVCHCGSRATNSDGRVTVTETEDGLVIRINL